MPAQSYKNAEVSLYDVNGKRVLRSKVSASNAVNSISRPNVAMGVYLLSVRGADGEAVNARLTHGGGGLNITASFVDASESLSAAPQMSKKAADAVGWGITVSAEGYFDSAFTIYPAKGRNTQKKITLYADPGAVVKGTFVDSRDGQEYKTVKIGYQTWMAENLNFWIDSSWCQEDSISYCRIYGRLYKWDEATAVCPMGWHLPTSVEWAALISAVGDSPGMKLKATSGWRELNGKDGNGTDDFGFSGMPGGIRERAITYSYGGIGVWGYWWTASGTASSLAHYRLMLTGSTAFIEAINSKGDARSVRCVKDL